MKRTLALFTLSIASVLLFSTSVIAAEPAVGYAVPKLQVDIPGVNFESPVAITLADGGEGISVNFLGAYISGVYKYLIGFALTVAIVMIMVGGLQYVLGSSSGDVKGGKKRMTDAIEGFVLLMFVYVILYTTNPELTLFRSLEIKSIKEVSYDTIIETFDSDGTANTATGTALYGVSFYQDCMLKKFGDSPSAVSLSPVTIEHAGGSRTYKVNAAAAADFQAVFDEIKASGVDYDITRDSAGGTVSWRANKNFPSKLSNHSWGTSIDINPDKNPNCPSECFDGLSKTACRCLTSGDCQTICESRHGDLPEVVYKAFINHNFDWLGDRQRPGKENTWQDYMHFDWNAGC